MQSPYQLVMFQQRGKGDYSYLKQASQILPAELFKNLMKSARMRNSTLRAMSVEDQYRECHENKQESYHNPPSSLCGDNIKFNNGQNIPTTAD